MRLGSAYGIVLGQALVSPCVSIALVIHGVTFSDEPPSITCDAQQLHFQPAPYWHMTIHTRSRPTTPRLPPPPACAAGAPASFFHNLTRLLVSNPSTVQKANPKSDPPAPAHALSPYPPLAIPGVLSNLQSPAKPSPDVLLFIYHAPATERPEPQPRLLFFIYDAHTQFTTIATPRLPAADEWEFSLDMDSLAYRPSFVEVFALNPRGLVWTRMGLGDM
jgi:hypothetical protein